jgi:hydroxysqualene synthase
MSLEPAEHYENFPVGSWLVPANKRPLVHAIYRFARFADDLADEGFQTCEQRVTALEVLKIAVESNLADEPNWKVNAKATLDQSQFVNAQSIVRDLQKRGLTQPLSPFRPYLLALIDAFIQDSLRSAPPDSPANRMFESHQDLLSYCERSANPVGRMMLLLFDCHHSHLLEYSDAICTGLQWVNFMQDVSLDVKKGRIYAPTKTLPDAATVLEQTLQARQLLVFGKPLINAVPLRLSLELRAILSGGLTLADKIIALEGATQTSRPTLSKIDIGRLILRFIRLR